MENTTMPTQTDSALPLTIAMVNGQAMLAMPKDLYIPPDAMEVFLEAFEGPLDLLLYLIKKQNLDILDIPIAEVTRQYMVYVDLMKEVSLELAAEYLVMAALLAEIKSRMLLPRPENCQTIEEDPRAELIRRLQEYERFKIAAEALEQLPRHGRDTFTASAGLEEMVFNRPQPDVQIQELLLAMGEVLKRAALNTSHQIHKEILSVHDRMSTIMDTLQHKDFAVFSTLFNPEEGRQGIVVTFLALLELLRHNLIEIVQAAAFGPIHLKLSTNDHHPTD
jgi:segregation and condensation protein A